MSATEGRVLPEVDGLGARGLRVLLLARSDRPVDAPGAPGEVDPVALVVLKQRVRNDAAGTLRYFAAQDVTVKMISGDSAVAVGAVAASLQLPRAERPADARELPADRDALADELERGGVFGRSPRRRSGTWCSRCSPAVTPWR